MSAVDKVLSVANGEIGYLEKATNYKLDDKTANAGYNNYTKYARDLYVLGAYNGNKQGYAWCDQFVDWCFVQAFGYQLAWEMTYQEARGSGAGCKESAAYYTKRNRLYGAPKVGDQIFFYVGGNVNHTGIVYKVDSEKVYTIEGNTSGASGVIDNGGGVCAKSYPLSSYSIAGYGRPNYDLIPEEDDGDMTQEKFNEYLDNYLAALAKKEPSSWSLDARKWAESVGVIQGDENGDKKYKKFCTREELAQMLYRVKG